MAIPPRLLILNYDGIFQSGLRTYIARWALKEREIVFRSTDNVAESRTNDYNKERG